MIEQIDKHLAAIPNPQERFNFIRGLRGMWERKLRHARNGKPQVLSAEQIETLLKDLRERGDAAIQEILDARR